MPPIPTINSVPGMQQWQQALSALVALPAQPRIPWNFQATSKQGGNYLTWQLVSGADGYVVQVSTTGDFSTGVTSVNLVGNNNTAYFDSVPTQGGSAPAKRYYKVAATSGTTSQPQAVQGLFSGVVSATAIAPNDTTTASTTSSDTTTTDDSQAQTRFGNYKVVLE